MMAGDDAPFCFTGHLADGTAIRGGYFAIDATLALRWRGSDGREVSHVYAMRTDGDLLMLYEAHTLAASLHRVPAPCGPSDCPNVTWTTLDAPAR